MRTLSPSVDCYCVTSLRRSVRGPSLLGTPCLFLRYIGYTHLSLFHVLVYLERSDFLVGDPFTCPHTFVFVFGLTNRSTLSTSTPSLTGTKSMMKNFYRNHRWGGVRIIGGHSTGSVPSTNMYNL